VDAFADADAGAGAGSDAARRTARLEARAAPLCERLGLEVELAVGAPCFAGALAAPAVAPPGFAEPANATCRLRERRSEPSAEERAAARASAAADAAAAVTTTRYVLGAVAALGVAALATCLLRAKRHFDRAAAAREEGEWPEYDASAFDEPSAEELRRRRLARFEPGGTGSGGGGGAGGAAAEAEVPAPAPASAHEPAPALAPAPR
jgi:hypothetical protein